MKQLNKHALISTMMFAGALGFTSCSSDNDLEQTNTTPEKSEVVKTQFAINIPNAGKVGSRMSDEIVQNNKPFRGMANIQLLPFVLASENGSVAESDAVAGNPISLGEIGATNDLLATSNAKVYSNVEIPLGTNAFLFYGEAKKETNDNDNKPEKTNGALTPKGINQDGIASAISFELNSILKKEVKETEDKLLEVLNGIASVEGWSTSTGYLRPLYESFILLKAGSSVSIRLTVENLYNELKGHPGDETLKNALITEIETYFDATEKEGSYTLTYKTEYDKQYPISLGLPAGSAQVKWDKESSKFEYLTGTDLKPNNAQVAALDDYVYPASLYYTTNTPVKVSDKTQSSNYTGDWNNILNLYQDGSTVTAATQSVALKDAIQYAVGRFDVKASFATGDILDNAGNAVTIGDNTFELTGVLVGGQKEVGFDFMPKAGTDKAVSIYDASVTSTFITQTAPTNIQNSTLVLATEETNVNFVIELKNKGEKFEGTDGIIHEGATFYLLGQLNKTDKDTHPIFGKDLITTANVTINSLKSAYNCIPDLKAPKLELGLSVDLEWQTGLTQDVEIQ